MEGRKVGDAQDKVVKVQEEVVNVEEELRQAEVKQLESRVREVVESEAERMVGFLNSKKDSELFGETEFELRDMALQLAGKVMEVMLDHRKKGGTKGAA